jgi:hypothetical protein
MRTVFLFAVPHRPPESGALSFARPPHPVTFLPEVMKHMSSVPYQHTPKALPAQHDRAEDISLSIEIRELLLSPNPTET